MTQLISGSYTKDYRDYCFYRWYRLGRPTFTDLEMAVEKFQDRMKPSTATLIKWAKEDDWEERANSLDVEVANKIQEQLISEKAKVLARHAGVGRKLVSLGIEYLENNPITSQGAALRAIQLGVEIEGEATQVEKLFTAVAKMDDTKVTTKLRKLLDKTKFQKDEEEESTTE